MTFLQIYGLVAGGIAISIFLPILKRLLPKAQPAGIQGIWKPIKPYVIAGVFSLVTALLVMAVINLDEVRDWRAALIAGYLWDSTVQKIGT